MRMTGAELLQQVPKGRADQIATAIANSGAKSGETSAAGADLAPTPIFEKDGKFFFWDETWGNAIGPYDTREQTQAELQKYAESLG